MLKALVLARTDPTFRNGLIVWGTALVVFLVIEVPSKDVLGWWPWPSASTTVWDAITWWHFVALIVVVIAIVLVGHFVLHWPASLLITASLLCALAIAIHAVVKAI